MSLFVMLVGCGTDSAQHDGCDTPSGLCYTANMQEDGENITIRLDEADPGPPALGDQNVWVVTILDQTGAPKDCALTASADMPAHGHGTSPHPQAHALEGTGQYEIRPLNLFMPGLWEIIFRVTCDETIDRIVFPFWIER